MSGVDTVQVTIFGKSYTLVSEGRPQVVQRLAAFVDEKMQEISSQIGDSGIGNVAILAALNIANDYFRMRDELENTASQIERRSSDLIKMIDQELT
ncbi:cell division protein ZapA [bacterium]|nr:cell division protein ZapA [candidate division CSSED10-310 bacterium]